MPRTVKETPLESRTARRRLFWGQPHWKTLEPGALHLGYRKPKEDAPGVWLVRRYKGRQRYEVRPLGLADDVREGEGVLSFAAAAKAAYAIAWTDTAKRRRTTALTVEEVVRDYISWLATNRLTARDAEVRANALILPTLGKLAVSELTTEMINDWLTALAGEGARLRGNHRRPRPTTKEQRRARQATGNRTLTILKAALNRAFRSGLVDDDTAWRRVRPFDQVNAARAGFLTAVECQRLIHAADAESGFQNLVHAALLTGARYGELRALLVRDFQHGKLHVRESKSGRSRWVVLTLEGVEFFEQLVAGRSGDEPLLSRGGAAWERNGQQRPMKEACERARIVPPVGFHALRHTYASLCVQADMNLMVLAKNLGHTSTAMVEAHYAHLRESHVDREIKASAPKFGLVFSGNVQR